MEWTFWNERQNFLHIYVTIIYKRIWFLLSTFKNCYYYYFFYFTILYWFCHTSTWIHHRRTRVPNPEPPSHLPPHTIPLGHPSAPAPSFLYPASNLDWQFVSYMILYMFWCHSLKSSPLPLPQSPKDCFIYLCLFCCLTYRVVITIFKFHIYFDRIYMITLVDWLVSPKRYAEVLPYLEIEYL